MKVLTKAVCAAAEMVIASQMGSFFLHTLNTSTKAVLHDYARGKSTSLFKRSLIREKQSCSQKLLEGAPIRGAI